MDEVLTLRPDVGWIGRDRLDQGMVLGILSL
jgi:hypothetical protein